MAKRKSARKIRKRKLNKNGNQKASLTSLWSSYTKSLREARGAAKGTKWEKPFKKDAEIYYRLYKKQGGKRKRI